MATITLKQPAFRTRQDLPEEVRRQSIELLNRSLAATLDLKTQVKQAHWNVKGKNFYQLHELFDVLADEIETFVDLIAERVTTLGGVAQGTVRMAAEISFLPEYPLDLHAALAHVETLADRYSRYGQHVREAIQQTADWHDATTSDIYTEVSRAIDMRLWFLESHLQEG